MRNEQLTNCWHLMVNGNLWPLVLVIYKVESVYESQEEWAERANSSRNVNNCICGDLDRTNNDPDYG